MVFVASLVHRERQKRPLPLDQRLGC